MKAITYLLALLFMFEFTPVAWAGSGEDEIVRIGIQRVRAYNEGNLDAVMGWFADTAVQTAPASPFRIEGKEAIQATYVSAFHTFPTRLYVPRQRLVRVYGDTTAITNTYYTLTLVDRSGKATTTHGRLDATYVRENGRWLVVNQHSSALPSQ